MSLIQTAYVTLGADRFGFLTIRGNSDGIVTKEKWEAWERHVHGPTGLLAVRLDSDPMAAGDGTPGDKAVRPRELWRYDKGFAGVIPSPLLYDQERGDSDGL